MLDRPPLLEELFAQPLSGKSDSYRCMFSRAVCFTHHISLYVCDCKSVVFHAPCVTLLTSTSSLDCVLLLFFAWIVVLLAMGFSVVKDDTQVKKACPSPQTIQKRLLKQTPSALLEKKHAYLMRSEPLAVI